MDPNVFETWTVAIDGDTGGLEAKLGDLSKTGKQFSSALSTAFDGLVLKGKSLDEVFSGLALRLSKLALDAAFKPLTDGLGSVFSSLLGGGIAGAGSGLLGSSLPVPFASGGVIQSPIAFPLGQGRSGIAGEAGAEAIMPLTRGPDGRLGVAASGAPSAPITVTFNVQAADAESFARSQSQIAAMLARAVALGQRNL